MSQLATSSSSKRRRPASELPLKSSAAFSVGPPASVPPPAAQGLLQMLIEWLRARRSATVGDGRLRVMETISLGEKRFVSVVDVDGQRFLLGGGASNVALLTQLQTDAKPFGEVLRKARAPRTRKPTAPTQANA